ncbi:DDHD domain-containing protein [Ditylenchus destructor]|uniref:DDHD domain-containing protein n=1 Tax=Ditylenchus destructor TaxID=166010 RepID=A0AAD4NEZ4_9BILA|nr:DDHD domain-containing protein [Ditylenchus destructor]
MSSDKSNTIKVIPPAPAAATTHKAAESKKQRVTELKNSEVRWFMRRDPDSKWTPFNGYDSTVLELAYRKRNDLELDEEMQAIGHELPVTDEVIVLNGLFKLDSEKLDEIISIYWKDESTKICRGTWFNADSMQPLDMKLADAIEEHHLKHFRGQQIPDSPVFSEAETSKKPVLTSLKWNENEEIRWNSVIDVTSTSSKKGHVISRFITWGKGTTYFKRGYTHETQFEDGRPNFSDLILVVHGIGQKGYENLIAKNTTQIRDAIKELMEKNYPEEKRRPVILPIEWRSTLTLDDGLTDTVTLPKMSNVRSTLNSVAMDIMYYQSPLYRTEIIKGVVKALNDTYTIFMQNNPTFNGAVSIFAHSLGCVITYDILTNWSPFLLYDDFVTKSIEEYIKESEDDGKEHELLEEFYNNRKKLRDAGGLIKQILVNKEKDELKFKVKYFFCVGSPLAVFIIMRGTDYTTVLPKKDQVERLFNIFHPYDPVAYRLEPLFHDNYRHIRPLKLLSYGDAKQCYNDMPYEVHRSYAKKKKKGNKNLPDKTDIVLTEEEKRSLNGKTGDEAESDSDDDRESVQAASSPRSQSPDTLPGERMIQVNTATGSTRSRWWGFGKASSKEEKDKEVKPSDVNGPMKSETVSNNHRAVSPPSRPPPPSNISIAEHQRHACETNESETAVKGQQRQPMKNMGDAGALIAAISIERRIPIRIDFQLKPALTDKSYWSMFKAHFSYWTNLDLTNFLLNTLYSDPPVTTPDDASSADA